MRWWLGELPKTRVAHAYRDSDKVGRFKHYMYKTVFGIDLLPHSDLLCLAPLCTPDTVGGVIPWSAFHVATEASLSSSSACRALDEYQIARVIMMISSP
jgi:hypothetical protein